MATKASYTSTHTMQHKYADITVWLLLQSYL